MKPSGSSHKRTVVKSWLKAVLALAAVVTVTVSLYLGRQALDASPVAAPVITVRPGVTPDVIKVTYFSSDVRCYTCVRIEQLTRQTVARHFAPELVSGRVVFQVVNLDSPGNRHFIEHYRLISKTVIVSDLAADEEVRWENLQDVWTRQKDERAFEAYVVDAVRRHLGTTT
jgi:hypothetical protein